MGVKRGLESAAVRRAVLRHGGDRAAAAAALGCTRQTVDYHLAHIDIPLGREDQAALEAFTAEALTRAGIR